MEINEDKHYPRECPECYARLQFLKIHGRPPTPIELGQDIFGTNCRCEEIHKFKIEKDGENGS